MSLIKKAAKHLSKPGGILLMIVLVGLGLYGAWPRQANLRDFDPVTMGKLEARMWRNYYNGKWIAVGRDLYILSRNEYGFSPLDSLCLAWDAGRASYVFRKSKNKAGARLAVPLLKNYYDVIRRSSKAGFDPAEAAELELEWWQMRRQNLDADSVGRAIADLAQVVYESDDARIGESARLRTRAMAYRDARRDGKMTAADWSYLEKQLTASWQKLSESIRKNSRN